MIRKELVDKLELVSLALAADDLIPIYKCFAFNKQTVMATNDVLAIASPCPTDEAFCLHGPTLLGLLKASLAETVDLKIEGEDIVIKSGRSVFKLPWFPLEDYPWHGPDGSYPDKASLDETFMWAIDQCLRTTSQDNTQLPLMGVYLRNGRIYSSDGDALTRCELSKSTKIKGAYILSKQFCSATLKVTTESEAKTGSLQFSNDWSHLSLDTGFQLYGRMLEVSNSLDHESLIRSSIKVEPKFVKLPEGLHHALERARVVADPESAKTWLQVDAGKLKITTEASMGIVNDVLAYPDKSHMVKAAVFAKRVQDCISSCTEMAIMDNCCAFRDGDKLYILAGNMS